MSEPLPPELGPLSVAEAWELTHLRDEVGVPPEGLAALLAVRRAVRGPGPPAGDDPERRRERWRWR